MSSIIREKTVGQERLMSQEGEGTIATAGAEEGWALQEKWRPLFPDGGNASGGGLRSDRFAVSRIGVQGE